MLTLRWLKKCPSYLSLFIFCQKGQKYWRKPAYWTNLSLGGHSLCITLYYLTCTTVHTLILHFTRASGYGSAIAGTDSSGRWAVAKPKPDVRAARKDCPIRTILLMTTFQGHFAVHCWNVNKRTNRSQWPYDIFLRTCFFPNFLQTNFFLDAPYWFYPFFVSVPIPLSQTLAACM